MAMESAKARFQKNDVANGQFGDWVASPLFAHAADAAMLEVLTNMPRASDAATAMANAYRLEGAQMFRRQLETLADKRKDQKPNKIGQLNE
jgi:hypothetical protein